ncbi:3-dehydroquinate synthase [Caldilinea sp.]|uniref:3-dehydroquinate synthase n=1 Tax=Caldilinea sp. TaxID=2293560 RepID=UPI002C7D0474|nr:3-dehydroquinate synthase [Anaerolineales bacterium]HQY92316.1 3-dehydroquinate synthase [Caldilinea sp.]
MSVHQLSDRNLILTGFMGVGKSTVGRLLAARLNRRFVDMDDVLVARFGKEIPAIFAEEGEEAFRVAEARLCQELADERGLVISTGGGALVNAQSKAALEASGVVLCLHAAEPVILARLAAATDRPLLPGEAEERRQRVHTLLQQRRMAYGAIAYQIDTTNLTGEEVADQVIEAAAGDQEARGLHRISVYSPAGDYDLLLGNGILADAGQLLVNRGLRPSLVALVTNDMVRPHAETIAASLAAAGFAPVICLAPEGEEHKTLESVALLYDQFIAAGLDRQGLVMAVGGGVIGDMAGFAAASYLRGVPFVQAPTSLLAMVDASVGGKTGVDLPQGKNLVGAFKQPAAVLMDVAVFATLPSDEFRSGLAEVVKHGIIGAPQLFTQLEEEGPANLLQLVVDAVRVKVRVVETDPYEQGVRATLNLGHTFGHAIEQVSHYRMRHGEAVAVGMVAAANMAVALGRCDAALAARIHTLLTRLGLPVSVAGYGVEEIHAAMAQDKKRLGKKLRFIIPQALGEVVMIDDPGDAVVRQAIQSVLG